MKNYPFQTLYYCCVSPYIDPPPGLLYSFHGRACDEASGTGFAISFDIKHTALSPHGDTRKQTAASNNRQKKVNIQTPPSEENASTNIL